LFNWRSALLYCCPDRDLNCGVLKAAAAMAGSSNAASALLDTLAVVQMCYPLIPAEQAAPIQRAPISPAQIAAAVTAAAATTATGAPPGLAGAVEAHVGKAAVVVVGGQQVDSSAAAGSSSSRGTSAAGSSTAASSGGGGGGAAAAVGQLAAIKASQLLYGMACERLMTLLLHRYQWIDVFIAARL
jgi:hypothetical protein